MLHKGDPAPAFSGVDQFGGERSLASMLATGPLVLFFYPRDFTFLCTREVCAFRDEHEALTIAGAVVCGVSTDDEATHAAFSERHDVPFPLLSDPSGRITSAYGARSSLGSSARRVTYVIDQRARVASVHHHELSVKKHIEGMRATLRTLLEDSAAAD